MAGVFTPEDHRSGLRDKIDDKLSTRDVCALENHTPVQDVELQQLKNGKRMHCDSLTLQASPDELAVGILLRVFAIATPVLSDYVSNRMKMIYGAQKWHLEAGESMGISRLRSRLEKDPSTLSRDIYLVTEILLNKLGSVFLADAVDIDNVKLPGLILQRMAIEVDCVGKTRTALFHGIQLSVGEVERCLRSLQHLGLRFNLHGVLPSATDDWLDNIDAVMHLAKHYNQQLNQARIFSNSHYRASNHIPRPWISHRRCAAGATFAGGQIKTFALCVRDTSRIILLRTLKCLQIKLCRTLTKVNLNIVGQNARKINFQCLVRLFTDSAKLKKLFNKSAEKSDLTVAILSVKSKLKRILDLRNRFAHGEKYSPREVLRCLELARDVVYTLSIPLPTAEEREFEVLKDEIECIRASGEWTESSVAVTIVLHSVCEQEMTLRLFFSHPQNLISREELIKEIKLIISTARRRKTGCRLLLHGPHGIGKTSVVRATAAQLRDVFHVQYYFQATSKQSLLADIRNFLSCRSNNARLTEAFKSFIGQLKERILIIFDDVREPDLVMSLLPETLKHCVLFTSVCELAWVEKEFVPQCVHSLAVPPLSLSDSLRLFEQILIETNQTSLLESIQRKNNIKDKVWGFLGNSMLGNPLAIRLAAYQLAQGNISLSSFERSSKLSNQSSRTSSDELAAGRVHVRGFYHVVRVGLKAIQSNSPAVLLCYALSVLSPNGVRFWLVELLGFFLDFPLHETVYGIRVLMKAGLVIVSQYEGLVVMREAVQCEVRQELRTLKLQLSDHKQKTLVDVGRYVTDRLSKVFLRMTIGLEHTATKTFSVAMSTEDDVCRRSAMEMSTYISHLQRVYSLSEVVDLQLSIGSFLQHSTPASLNWWINFRCLLCLAWCHFHLGDKVSHEEKLSSACTLCQQNNQFILLLSRMRPYINDVGMFTSCWRNICCLDTGFEIPPITWQDFDDDLVATATQLALTVKVLSRCGDYYSAFCLSKQLTPLVARCLKVFDSSANAIVLGCVIMIGRIHLHVGNVQDAYETVLSVYKTWLPLREECGIGLHRRVAEFALYVMRAVVDYSRPERAVLLLEISYAAVSLVWKVYPMTYLVLNICASAFKLCRGRLNWMVSSDCGDLPYQFEYAKDFSLLLDTWLTRLLFIAKFTGKFFHYRHVQMVCRCFYHAMICLFATSDKNPKVFDRLFETFLHGLREFLGRYRQISFCLAWSVKFMAMFGLLTLQGPSDDLLLYLTRNLHEADVKKALSSGDLLAFHNFIYGLDKHKQKRFFEVLSQPLAFYLENHFCIFPPLSKEEKQVIDFLLSKGLDVKNAHLTFSKEFFTQLFEVSHNPQKVFGSRRAKLEYLAEFWNSGR